VPRNPVTTAPPSSTKWICAIVRSVVPVRHMPNVMTALTAEAPRADQSKSEVQSGTSQITPGKASRPLSSQVSGEGHLPTFLTIEQAAEVLNIHEKTAYRWAAEGRLPGAFRVNRCWRVSRPRLIQFSLKGAGGASQP
jgi:excisionase family DNA binding protein